jgi:hypothetical protein
MLRDTWYVYHATWGHVNGVHNIFLSSVMPTLQPQKLYSFTDFITHTHTLKFYSCLNQILKLQQNESSSSSQNFLFPMTKTENFFPPETVCRICLSFTRRPWYFHCDLDFGILLPYKLEYKAAPFSSTKKLEKVFFCVQNWIYNLVLRIVIRKK